MKIKEQNRTIWIWWRNNINSVLPQIFGALFLAYPLARPAFFLQGGIETKKRNGKLTLPSTILEEGITVDPLPILKNKIVDLHIPQSLFLKREFDLPKAVGKKIASASRLNLAHNTPFELDQVYWATTSTSDKHVFKCTQFVMKVGTLDNLVRRISSCGGTVRKVCIDLPEKLVVADFGWNLVKYGHMLRKINAVILLVLVLVLSGAWVRDYRAEIHLLDKMKIQVDELQTQLLQKRKELSVLEDQNSKKQKTLSRLSQSSAFLHILGVLTNELSDQTWVSQVMFQNEEVLISGNTRVPASGLVLTLNSVEQINEPKIVGSVSQDRNTKSENFKLGFSLRGEE